VGIPLIHIRSSSYRLCVFLLAVSVPGSILAQENAAPTTAAKKNKPSAAATRAADGSKGKAAKKLAESIAETDADANSARSATLKGTVTYVTDGDTFTLSVGKKEYKIRLFGIDAPEIDQPFGKQAAQALSKLVLAKDVRVSTFGQDKYGNSLGIVELDGKNVNLELVKQGGAWHYKAYSDSKTLAAAEDDAKKAKIGLWADENPMPPWQWRQQTAADADDPFAAKPENQKTPAAAQSPSDQSQKFWLTTSSNVRHNSKCRYYQKTKGRLCGPDEGTPCKVCGG
jgi:micrococcal nuclease